MTRRNLFRSLTACIVASALDLGYLADVVRRKWKFEKRIVRVDNGYGGSVFFLNLMQAPIGHMPSHGVEGCFQHQGKYGSKELAESRGDAIILERQYELGEPV